MSIQLDDAHPDLYLQSHAIVRLSAPQAITAAQFNTHQNAFISPASEHLSSFNLPLNTNGTLDFGYAGVDDLAVNTQIAYRMTRGGTNVFHRSNTVIPSNVTVNYNSWNRGDWIWEDGERVYNDNIFRTNNIVAPITGGLIIQRSDLIRQIKQNESVWFGSQTHIANIYEIWTQNGGVSEFALIDGYYRTISGTVSNNIWALVPGGLIAADISGFDTWPVGNRTVNGTNVPVREL
jgi:hypothetical protein